MLAQKLEQAPLGEPLVSVQTMEKQWVVLPQATLHPLVELMAWTLQVQFEAQV
jgi:hypothetical protein